MQEPTPAPPFQRLHVWSLTLSFAITTLIIGLLTLPAVLIARRAHEEPFEGSPPWAAPGASPQPLPGASGAPRPWEGPYWHHGWGGPYPMLLQHHHPLSPAFHVLVIVSMAILAGIGGAIIAALYNAFLPKKM